MKTYIGNNFDGNICLKKCIYPGSSCGLVCRICPPKDGYLFGKLVEVTATEHKMPLKLSWFYVMTVMSFPRAVILELEDEERLHFAFTLYNEGRVRKKGS